MLIVGAGAVRRRGGPPPRRGRASRSCASSRATGPTAASTAAPSSTGSSPPDAQWSSSPNIRARPEDYPIDDTESDIVAADVRTASAADAAVRAAHWQRNMPSDFRVRTLDGVADDWPLTYEDLEPYYERGRRRLRRLGPRRRHRAYPPGEDPPLPPLPLGPAGSPVARGAQRAGLALVAGAERDRHAPPTTALNPCVQRGTCLQGCAEGAKGIDRSSRTGRSRSRTGVELVTGARVRQIATDADGLVTGASYVDGDGGEHFQPGRRRRCSPRTAIGTPRLLLLSARRASRRARELVRPRRQAPDDAPVRRP